MLDRRNGKGRRVTSVLPMEPNEPLWKRAPRQDENGKPFSDFMMVIPKLRLKPAHIIQDTVTRIEQVLESYSKHVVFADLNLRINVLWVIVRPVPGICFDLPCAINHHVPEALLVAQPNF